MHGILIKFLTPNTREPSFVDLFAPILPDLNDFYWSYPDLPCDSFPAPVNLITDDDCLYVHFRHETLSFWKPGVFAKAAPYFPGDEFLSMFAIPPESSPQELLEKFASKHSTLEEPDQVDPAIILEYVDSTCWEFYATEFSLVLRLQESLAPRSDIQTFRGHRNQRHRLRAAAGIRA